MTKVELVESKRIKTDKPKFEVGDSVKIHLKIVEGDKERIQIFQGTVIKRSGAGKKETVTVRKISDGVGVERIFPILSPRVARIETVSSGRVRRAKLYYLRELAGKAAKLKSDANTKVSEAQKASSAASQS